MTDLLATAELAVYAILSPAVLFIIFYHFRVGLLGWLYLFAFCTLRLVGGALSMGTSSLGSVISSVGLSPLLLATSGILHEARILRSHRSHRTRKWLEWTCVGLFHILVATGVALLGIGASALQASNNPTASDLQSVDVGIALLTVSWAILVVWAAKTALTGLTGQRVNVAATTTVEAGTSLLCAVCLGLVFVGIRVLYSVVTLSTRKATAAFSSVWFEFLPELVAVLYFILIGIRKRHDVSLS